MKQPKRGLRKEQPDYPLQGTKLDVSLARVLSFSPKERRIYIRKVLTGLGRQIRADQMALKKRVPFKREMRDLRNLLYEPPDKYLAADDKTRKRNVLKTGAPGGTHTYWSRQQMWKMKTKMGDLSEDILNKSPALISQLDKFLDPTLAGKRKLRNEKVGAIRNLLAYLQFNQGVGTAFPPAHAKFFADRFLPKKGDAIVFDSSAGFGGRLLGSLCVNRAGHIRYLATDPEKRNKPAYL